MIDLFQAAKNLRKLQAGPAHAAAINLAEQELPAKLLDAYMAFEKAYEAFPGEADASEAGRVVDTAFS